jgi:hypothetical protein
MLTLFLSLELCAERVIYISPEGDDQNNGRLEFPVRTPAIASQLIRDALMDQPREDVSVVFRSGIFYLSEPWTMRALSW